jgi:hypothetical protein
MAGREVKRVAFTASVAAALQVVILDCARAESVFVKFRGLVSLESFECTSVSRSSLVERVCYDSANEYMLIKLNGTYYHYCEIPGGKVRELLTADSIGTYYAQNIKGSGSTGPYDCRTRKVPD